MRIIFSIITLFLLFGCSNNNMKPTDFKDQKPRLIIEEYLTGNVKEWVHDYYLVSVPKSNMIYYDPSGPKKGVGHVVKGSSYLSATLQEVRASYRDSEVNKKDDIGFRIVRYLYGKEFKNNEK